MSGSGGNNGGGSYGAGSGPSPPMYGSAPGGPMSYSGSLSLVVGSYPSGSSSSSGGSSYSAGAPAGSNYYGNGGGSDSGSFVCQCPPGFTGQFCESRDPCTPNPCQNGAQCIPQGSTFMCQCPPGFSGQRLVFIFPNSNFISLSNWHELDARTKTHACQIHAKTAHCVFLVVQPATAVLPSCASVYKVSPANIANRVTPVPRALVKTVANVSLKVTHTPANAHPLIWDQIVVNILLISAI